MVYEVAGTIYVPGSKVLRTIPSLLFINEEFQIVNISAMGKSEVDKNSFIE